MGFNTSSHGPMTWGYPHLGPSTPPNLGWIAMSGRSCGAGKGSCRTCVDRLACCCSLKAEFPANSILKTLYIPCIYIYIHLTDIYINIIYLTYIYTPYIYIIFNYTPYILIYYILYVILIYIYMYTPYIYVYIYIHTPYIYIYTYTPHTHTYIYIYTLYMYIYIHLIYIYTHLILYIYTYIHLIYHVGIS